jgi:AcrR family transcriptional regulator
VSARISTRTGSRRQALPRLTREQKRAVNRQRLLDAALEVFSERGYYAATIEEIVEASGLSNGALYYNFRNKEDLFLALFDQRIEARIEAIERAFGGGAGSSEEGATQVHAAAMQSVRDIDSPREWAMFFEFVAHAGRTPAFQRDFRKRTRRMRQAFARAIERQTADLGAELSVPAEQAAVAVAALTQGVAVQRITDPRSVPDELLGALVVYLLRGMTTTAAQ